MTVSGMSFADAGKVISLNDGTTDVVLDMIVVNVPYPSTKINVEVIQGNLETKAVIRDKMSNDVLEVYTETTESVHQMPSKGMFSFLRSDRSTYNKTLTKSFDVGPCEIEVLSRVEIYTSGSFRQFNDCKKVWQRR